MIFKAVTDEAWDYFTNVCGRMQLTNTFDAVLVEERADMQACLTFGQTESQYLKELHLSLELADVTLAFKDGKQIQSHKVILAATSPMAHTNYGELRQLRPRCAWRGAWTQPWPPAP